MSLQVNVLAKIKMAIRTAFMDAIAALKVAKTIVRMCQVKNLLENVFRTFHLHIVDALKRQGEVEMIAQNYFA